MAKRKAAGEQKPVEEQGEFFTEEKFNDLMLLKAATFEAVGLENAAGIVMQEAVACFQQIGGDLRYANLLRDLAAKIRDAAVTLRQDQRRMARAYGEKYNDVSMLALAKALGRG